MVLAIFVGTLTHYRFPLHPTAWDHPEKALGCLLAGLAIVILPWFAGIRRKFCRFTFESSSLIFSFVILLAAIALYSLWAHMLLGGIPHIDDSMAAVWAAEVYLSGDLTRPLPKNPEFFEVFGVLGARANLGWWTSMYPPAWSIILMPFVALGVSWLANPLLAGLLAVFTGLLATELFDRRTGRLTSLFMLLSPFVGGLAAMQLSHISTGLCCVVAWLMVLRLLKTGQIHYGVFAGLALGLALLNRPVTAVILGCVIGIAPLVRWNDSLKARKGVLAAVSTVILCGVLLLTYQGIITGDPMTPGHKVTMGDWAKIGFGKLGASSEHTVEMGLRNTGLRMEVLNRLLLGWPIPSFLAVLLPLVLLRQKWTMLWLLLPIFLLSGLFMMFWYYEEYYPARYLFTGVPYLLVLTAAGIAYLTREEASKRVRSIASGTALGCTLFTLCCSNEDFHDFFIPQHGDVEPILEQVLAAYEIDNAVVFMDSVGRMDTDGTSRNDYYATGFRLNNLDLDGPVVFVRNLPKNDNNKMVKQYPGRSYYLYRFDRRACKAWLYHIPLREDGRLANPVLIQPQDDLLMTGQPPLP